MNTILAAPAPLQQSASATGGIVAGGAAGIVLICFLIWRIWLYHPHAKNGQQVDPDKHHKLKITDAIVALLVGGILGGVFGQLRDTTMSSMNSTADSVLGSTVSGQQNTAGH